MHGCGGDQKDNQAAMYVPSTASKMVVAVVVVVLVVCMYVCVKRLRFFFLLLGFQSVLSAVFVNSAFFFSFSCYSLASMQRSLALQWIREKTK